MLNILISLITFANFTHTAFAQPNGYFSDQEVIQQNREKSKAESALQDSVSKPNQKSTPIDTSKITQGIDSSAYFEVKDHFLGYSAIFDGTNQLRGAKYTSILNIGLYSATEKSPAGRSQMRFVFGIEFDAFEISQLVQVYTGIGGTLGDHKGLYIDAGFDIRPFEWFKIQAGLDFNTSTKIAPQINAGFTW